MTKKGFPLFSEGHLAEFVFVETRHVGPAVVRCQFALHREGHFVFIEHGFYEDVVTSFLAVENELHVACHREDFIVSPFLVEFGRIFLCGAVVAEFHQAGKRIDHHFVAESQGGTGSFQFDAGVGCFNDIFQQIGFKIGEFALCEFRGTVVVVPTEVLVRPDGVAFFFCEKRIKVEVSVQALHVGGYVEDAPHQTTLVDVLADVGCVGEQQIDEAVGLDGLVPPLFSHLLGFLAFAVFGDVGVAVIAILNSMRALEYKK